MKCHRAILLIPLTCIVSEAQTKKSESSVSQVLEDYIQLANDLTKLLESVENSETALKASSELEKLIIKTGAIKDSLTKFSEFKPEESAKYLQLYEKPMRVSWGKCYDQIYRLQKQQCYRQMNFARNFRILCELIQL